MGNPLQTYIKDDFEIGREEGYKKGWEECKQKVLKLCKKHEVLGEYEAYLNLDLEGEIQEL